VNLKLNCGLVIALSQAGKADCNQKPLHGHRRARIPITPVIPGTRCSRLSTFRKRDQTDLSQRR
jgi:hypothetical protein